MSQMKEILKENRKAVALYITTGLLIAFLTNYKIKFFQQIIDGFNSHSINIDIIAAYGLVLISFYMLNYLDEYPKQKLGNAIYLDFKMQALKKVSRIQYIDYQSLGTGKLTQSIENGANAGKGIIFGFWLCVIRQLIPTIIFSVLIIWRMNKFITYLILCGYVIVFIITNLLLKVLYVIKENILCNEEMMNHYLVRGFMEMVVFRMNRRFPYEIQKAESSKTEIVKSKVKMNMIHEAFFTIFALLVAVLNVGILVFAWLNQSVSIGTSVALLSLVENAYTPIAIFNVLFVQYKLDKATYRKFEEFFNMKNDEQLDIGKSIVVEQGEIHIKNLYFQYDRKMVINNLNIQIHRGEKIALVGSSGSGKTTLVKLLLGLLKYESGSIKIDGHELKEICLNSLYENMSYISQDAPVFDGTIRENMIYNQNVYSDYIWEVLKKLKLNDLVLKMEKGIDTLIGERGMTLSGGERQRLALARLWFQKNNIVILDEATSALDNITEEDVMKEIMILLSGKTVIAIAHRLTSIINFDRIIVFNDGCIVEQGTFNELLSNGLYFYDLYKSAGSN
ncbi:ABC transporter ATP-binding protein [Lacrimispora amygdalina]|uniref:ABC transporter ATP-binding protein n=1 Tax=Lacrimispora amygdalina TaxID=253257 RepID=A0A3E2NC98_9FIRM|nr:ABC transporter ATP-binding protein [Clostridium indicum]RFZ78625.1 ABC transporter ATP-binding protein [Clostridium indicum]